MNANNLTQTINNIFNNKINKDLITNLELIKCLTKLIKQ